jgi:ankyrin repeat protein
MVGSHEIAELLIVKGSSINEKNAAVVYTALMFSANQGYLDILKYLIYKGAS